MPKFKRPVATLARRDHFSSTEVGLTHPKRQSSIKLADNGNINIMPNSDFGIILDEHSRTVAIFADTLKVITKQQDGFRWNDLSFNYEATSYTEPTFVHYESDDIVNIYDGVDEFFD